MTPHSQLEESMVRPSMTLHNFGEGEREQGVSPRCNPQDRLYRVDLLTKQNSALANEAARTVFRLCCNGLLENCLNHGKSSLHLFVWKDSTLF